VALIDRADPRLSLKEQAALLSISRSSLYYQPAGPSPEEVALKHRIDAIYTASPFYGARRIAAQLAAEGHAINRKTVARYMAEMRLTAIYPGPNLSRRAHQAGIYPYLLRQVTANRPNHVWGVDITYVRCRHGWLYLVAVLDWYSRYVVSWELDQTLAQSFVMAAVERALTVATPEIWNSDQGSHFTSPQYTARLKAAGVQISMDGKGRALDNVFTERLWRTVKYEEIYLHDYASPREARTGLSTYFAFYNQRRLHQALAYRPPAAVYAG
jgi:putative transposase